jgi:hypothetical protein
MITLYNKKQQKRLTFNDFEEIESNFNKKGEFVRSMLSHDSIILFGSEIIEPKSATGTLEIFQNGSVKFSFPLIPCILENCEVIALNLRNCNPNYDLTGFKFLEFAIIYNYITNTLNRVLECLLTKYFDKKEYVISFNYRNIRNCLLYFDTGDNAFYDMVTKHGICYSIKKEQEIIFNDPFEHATEEKPIPMFGWLLYGLCVPFGYSPKMLDKVMVKSIAKFNESYPGKTVISRKNPW